MADPAGEPNNRPPRVDFDRRLKVEFVARGSPRTPNRSSLASSTTPLALLPPRPSYCRIADMGGMAGTTWSLCCGRRSSDCSPVTKM